MAVSSVTEKTQSDLAHLIHPLYHPSDHQKPRIWVEGNGAILKDMDGTEVIDGLSGLWNVNVGHGRRELAEAAMDQMNTLAYCSSYTGASNLPAIELAERLSQYTYPSINAFYFTSGGANRQRVRLKLHAFTGRFKANRTKSKSFRASSAITA